MEILIRELHQQEQVPYELLLDADPSRVTVDDYLSKGNSFAAEYNSEVIGIIVIVSIGKNIDEIVNLAVRKDCRGKGIAKKLIEFAIKTSEIKGKIELMIGTGNSSLDQLALYQKCGFRIDAIKKNYFIDNYDEVIIENGIRCADMVVLKRLLSSVN